MYESSSLKRICRLREQARRYASRRFPLSLTTTHSVQCGPYFIRVPRTASHFDPHERIEGEIEFEL